jgi:hypothetical protein
MPKLTREQLLTKLEVIHQSQVILLEQLQIAQLDNQPPLKASTDRLFEQANQVLDLRGMFL